MDDCRAAGIILDALSDICNSKINSKNTEVIKSDESPYFTTLGKFVTENKDLSVINDAAYWNYQREKIYIRSKESNTQKRNRTKGRIRKYRINKVVKSTKLSICSQCGSRRIEANGRMKRDIVDIKFGNGYMKRWTVRYCTTYYKCKECNCSSASDDRNQEKSQFGPGISSFIIYCIIDLHIAQNMTSRIIFKLFGIHIEQSTLNRLKSRMAIKYLETYTKIKETMISGKLIHADETHISVKGKDTYVWVFTSMEEVIYVWSETREGSIATEFLQNFNGVLVSDFYAGYSSIKCKHQMCLIHLIRDMNDDMRKEPFNQELKNMTKDFGELVRSIIETVDKHGLSNEHLKIHKPDVSLYFEQLKSTNYATEVAIKLRKRLINNMNELFTFIDYDNIPWNNNNAEHAIKAFAKIRNVISGTTNEVGIRDYMVLLSISQTCAYKSMDFLEFLISEKTSI
ncbi:MAG: IS66 family transposase [Rhodospirillaceae bacterium]